MPGTVLTLGERGEAMLREATMWIREATLYKNVPAMDCYLMRPPFHCRLGEGSGEA